MIATRTPLRVSFFGGGTDFKDYYERDYGCVLSSAINQYVYIIVNKKFDGRIHLNYRITEVVDSVEGITHPTIKEGMKLAGVNEGIEISALADVPAHGTGLGSSSSFIVGVLNALHAYRGDAADAETLAQEAAKIEIDILKEPIGKQDQYIAAYGDLRFIRFNKDGSVTTTPVKASQETVDELYGRLLFFYTGVTRKASDVLAEQKQNIPDKIGTLDSMRKIAEKMFDELNHNRFGQFGELLHESWQLKQSLASNVSNSMIRQHYKKAIDAGATGGKLLGAGGGGFLLFYCEKEKQDAVRKALSDLKECSFRMEKEGSRIVYRDR